MPRPRAGARRSAVASRSTSAGAERPGASRRRRIQTKSAQSEKRQESDDDDDCANEVDDAVHEFVLRVGYGVIVASGGNRGVRPGIIIPGRDAPSSLHSHHGEGTGQNLRCLCASEQSVRVFLCNLRSGNATRLGISDLRRSNDGRKNNAPWNALTSAAMPARHAVGSLLSSRLD
jgi:hypothetical protein